ncbi:hypothetical protein NPIL_609281 [Nephila pilipes]|uniref:Uncharacterized protein n=1 Tax=Nephila pilipes TaxID=299642 RepID=A0A8X6MN47_NEPPI|nr:hypothetical protein NPIL_609281 [Nephila pilipes]
MDSFLRKLKAQLEKKKQSDGKIIGERARLMDTVKNKLTTYYGNTIHARAQNIREMRQAIWDNKAQEFKDKNNLRKVVSEAIKPILKDLLHLKLLRRCLEGIVDVLCLPGPKSLDQVNDFMSLCQYHKSIPTQDGNKDKMNKSFLCR